MVKVELGFKSYLCKPFFDDQHYFAGQKAVCRTCLEGKPDKGGPEAAVALASP